MTANSLLLCSVLAVGLAGCFVLDGPCDLTLVEVTARVKGNVELATTSITTDHAINELAANDAGNGADAASLEDAGSAADGGESGDAGVGATGSVCTSVVTGGNQDGRFLLDVTCENPNGPSDGNTLDLQFRVPDPRTLDSGAAAAANFAMSVTYANRKTCVEDILRTVPIDVTTSYSQTNKSTLEFSLTGQFDGSQVKSWLNADSITGNSAASCDAPFPFSSLSFSVVVDQSSSDFKTSTSCGD